MWKCVLAAVRTVAGPPENLAERRPERGNEGLTVTITLISEATP